MSYSLRARDLIVCETLEKCASLAERAGQGEWNFILNNGSMLFVGARACEHWLHLDAPVGKGTALGHDAWRLLQLHQGLGGLSKLALPHSQSSLRLRAEIPLCEDVDLRTRLSEACAGLKATAGRLHGEAKTARPQAYSSSISQEKERTDTASLQQLFEESGWKFTERTQTKLAVDLEAGNGFYQAIVEEQANGAVSVSVELARDTSFGESSKRAIGALLLRASAEIRMARAVIKEGEEGATAGFEALFQTAPCAAELDHALSALAIACRLCGQAIAAIQDESIAKNYLAAQGLLVKSK